MSNRATQSADDRAVQEPFADISISDPVLAKQAWPPRTPIYTSAKFSYDGKYILVGTSSDVHYVLHSFENTVVARLEGNVTPLRSCVLPSGCLTRLSLQDIKVLSCLDKIRIIHLFLKLVFQEKRQAGLQTVVMLSQVCLMFLCNKHMEPLDTDLLHYRLQRWSDLYLGCQSSSRQ